MEAQKHNKTDLTATGNPDPQDTQDNKMVSEGALTSVQYYNEEVQDNKQKSTEETKIKRSLTRHLFTFY